jgi:hypothetical protein
MEALAGEVCRVLDGQAEAHSYPPPAAPGAVEASPDG